MTRSWRLVCALALLAALHAIRAAGQKLPVNLVLIAEGEEEDGSMHLPQVGRRPSALLKLNLVAV